MKNKELIKFLNELPKEAIIYTEADHGQTPTVAGLVMVSTSSEQPYMDDGDMNWEEVNNVNKEDVKSILIG